MGFLTNNICYPTSAEAADAYFSVLQPVLVKGGGSSDFYHFYSNVASIWYLDEYSITSGGVFTLLYHGVLPLPSFASCVTGPLQTWDPVLGAAFFSLALTWVFGMYLLGKSSGVLVNFVRRA